MFSMNAKQKEEIGLLKILRTNERMMLTVKIYKEFEIQQTHGKNQIHNRWERLGVNKGHARMWFLVLMKSALHELALPCIISLLELVNFLMNFAQFNHVFVSGYIVAVKICEAKPYMMHSHSNTAWQKSQFEMFYDIVNDHSYIMIQEWITNPNTGFQSLTFHIGGHTHLVHLICPTAGKKLVVSKENMVVLVTVLKGRVKMLPRCWGWRLIWDS